LFDHTNGASTGYSERLNGGTNEKYGVSRSMSVMPGDTIKVQVYAKYADPNNANWNQTLTNLMSAIASNTGGIVVDGGGYSSSTSSFSFGGLVNTGGSSPSSPKAFLNWIIFDRDYNFKDGGFIQVSQAAKETGTDGPHEKLSKNDILIKEPGYIYIYLSNEETSPVEVFFDDLNVVQVKSPVVQMDDYYPFGLTFNSYQRENTVHQDYLYGGKEIQDELSLGWFDFLARQYEPTTGRFLAIDPLADKMRRYSPYAYSFDNPIRFTDPDGMEAMAADGDPNAKKEKGDDAKEKSRKNVDPPKTGSGNPEKREKTLNPLKASFWKEIGKGFSQLGKKFVSLFTNPGESWFGDDESVIDDLNDDPKNVNESQTDPMGTGKWMDYGQTNPLFNSKAPAKGSDGEQIIMTEDGQTQVVNPDKKKLKVTRDTTYSTVTTSDGTMYDQYHVIQNGRDTVDHRAFVSKKRK
jgi:RHS repeat-associated protein